ncbi:MAG: glycine--tRNA ligase [Patescibacteria group bacterium]|nr:glycine--tRNA ligase [Patescibacteria group bacterium]
MESKIDKIISLCKRRGFIFPGSEIYGGLANSWDYGPIGVELKNNIKQLWWKRFVQSRDDIVGIDASLIMNPKVWEASGHLATFNDPLVECKKCHSRFRADQIDSSKPCPTCGAKDSFTEAHMFNLMLKTFLGPAEEAANVVYFRPETAQAMFVDFKNVLQTTRKKLPFGIAQIGKAFRNEITPGNFIFRTREFEQMEIEYFIKPPKKDEDWQEIFEMWRKEMLEWMKAVGIEIEKVHELEVEKDKLAHYSKRTIDFEYEFPFGTKELYGLAYRTDFDLKNHARASGEDLSYADPETNEKVIPHVIEPTWGVDRTVLAVLCSAYDDSNPERLVLKLPYKVAPYKVAVFPLLKNKPELVSKAKEIYGDLRKDLMTVWDDRGNVGKRYYAQDEIGTPFCITVDFDSLEDNAVTVRDRDTMKQERINISKLKEYLGVKLGIFN